MEINIKEKLVIGFSFCGPTYGESARDKLENYYIDNDNVYYCVVTDNKDYFAGLKRKNLIVNELKDFYSRFPELEKNEFYLESNSKDDFALKCNESGYVFPFSTFRFNVLQAIELGIKNVALMCTDAVVDFELLNEESFFDEKGITYNAVSEWDEHLDNSNMRYVSDYLLMRFGLRANEIVRVLDAAARLFIPTSLFQLKKLFVLWNNVIEYLYENDLIKYFKGGYLVNDEYILAPIYDVLGLNKRYQQTSHRIFKVKHDPALERYWRTCGAEGLIEHHNYEEFLKLNNLSLT